MFALMPINIYGLSSRSSNLYHDYQYNRIPKLLELVDEKYQQAEHLCENEREAEKPKKSVEIYYEELLPNDEEGEWEDEEYEVEEETAPPPPPAPVQTHVAPPYYAQQPKQQQRQQRQQQPQTMQQPTQLPPVPSSEFIPVGIPPIGNPVQPNYASETRTAASYTAQYAATDNQTIPPPPNGYQSVGSVAPAFLSGIPQAAPLALDVNNSTPDQPTESKKARKRRLKQSNASK